MIAEESGNRANMSYLSMAMVMTFFRTETQPSDKLTALDNIKLAICNYFDSANIAQLRAALGILATFLDRLQSHESAAVIAGFACVAPTAAPSVPEFNAAIAHLRDVLGTQTYESLANEGEMMTMAAMVTYAYDQIDQARPELEQLP